MGMSQPNEPIDAIRAASRRMVRELGFMAPTLAGTAYSPSAVHAILELGLRGALTSAQLAEALRLEKSSVSRLVRKLADAGELKESAAGADARAKPLALTAHGRRTFAAINSFGRRQVSSALARMTAAGRQALHDGLAAYAQALEDEGRGLPTALPAVEIRQGWYPGAIGRAAEMHAAYYSRAAGFGQFFESQVATGMAAFASRLGHPRNGLWTAWQAGRILGTVAIDGEELTAGNAAHLRWFVVDDALRGQGAGRLLLDQALAFCVHGGFASVHLWTFQGLDAARHLYEGAGFVLQEERPGARWGREVVEQRFVRALQA
jgi:DNA-binding MarR family transcriptional regulator/N-acetylglutamate synthase-like GNAT family acetyltransferase